MADFPRYTTVFRIWPAAATWSAGASPRSDYGYVGGAMRWTAVLESICDIQSYREAADADETPLSGSPAELPPNWPFADPTVVEFHCFKEPLHAPAAGADASIAATC